MAGVSSVYSTEDSASELGHSIQYLFDWGDGTNSGWLPIGKNSASKFWALPGSYSVRAKARCSTHNLIISDWSSALDVSIQKLTLITPNGGEVIPSGKPYTIEWTALSQAEKFKIFYSMDNGATWILITSDATGTSHSWTVPVPPSNKSSCYVKVVGYSASNPKVGEDKSDKPFTIGVVRLVSPNGGEVLESGVPHQIQWEINGTKSDVTKVNLYYATNGGVSYVLIQSLIVTVDPGTRPWAMSYPWTVPTPTANMGKCYVKVVAYSGNTVVGTDTSDKPFTIEGVKLTQPNEGEVLKTGDPYTIKWEINGTKSDVTKVNLYYTTNGGASYTLIESIPTVDPGTRPWVMDRPWTVPTLTANMGKCYVKVVAYSGNTVVGTDTSDNPFEIAVVKLLTLNGGEALESGSSYPIEWEINGTKSPVATVKLYYSIDGGATWSLITTLDGSFRNYDWIPLVQTTKTKCKVKVVIYDTKGVAAANDMSDSFFTIEP
jgi:protein involved in ribonucleotide reduction